jgi:hypothetical protein
MKSMSQALLWEMSRHWYWLVIGFFAAALFPFLSLFSLRSLGIPPESPEMIRIHAFLMTFHFLIFFFGVIGTQGPIQRLYGYPLSNATIACWSMFSGIGLMFSGVAIMLLWFNVQFQASWPVLGTALIAIAMSLFTFVVISIVKIDLVSGLWQSSFAGWYWLGLFFIPWAAMGCSVTVCLFGRVPLVVAVVAALVGIIVLVAIASMVQPFRVDRFRPGRFSSASDRTSKWSIERQNGCGCGRRLDCVACAELSNRSDGVDELDSKLVSATSNCRDSAHNRDACRYRIQSPSVSP